MTAENPSNRKDEFLGHPQSLFFLFFAELWERFSYYGMRALLVLYLVNALKLDEANASLLYGSYTGLVYLTPIIGGFLADRLLGHQAAVVFGGILMALGHFFMAVEHPVFLYGALALIILGNGFFKPNISTMVGSLYSDEDPRKDGAFTILYMGINIGAFFSGIVCGYLAHAFGWHYGFGAAGVGMVIGLSVFLFGRKELGSVGLPPSQERFSKPAFLGLSRPFWVYIFTFLTVPLIGWLLKHHTLVPQTMSVIIAIFAIYLLVQVVKAAPEERGGIIVILVLTAFSVVFWAFFEQAGSSMNLFTDSLVNRDLWGFTIPTAWYQSINPFFIILFGLPFAWLWVRLDKANLNPSSALKFVFGLAQLSLGFVFMVVAAKEAQVNGASSPLWIILAYLFHTTGEICLSPVGLSMISKLSPARLTGQLMGVWFLSSAYANVVGGHIASLNAGESAGYLTVFSAIVQASAICAVVLLVLTPVLNRLVKSR